MEQTDLIPFTSVIAGMLLCKRVLTSGEIVNFISELSCEGMEIDEYWNNEELSPIVYMNDQYSFGLKDGLFYDSVLSSGLNVSDFLVAHTDIRVLDYIHSQAKYEEMYLRNIVLKEGDLSTKISLGDLKIPLVKEMLLSKPKVKKKSFLYTLWAEIR